MVTCKRKGCGKEYDPSNNPSNACSFHTGGPVFHEGLKSWSCCPKATVLDFDEFMKIPGCHESTHSDEVPKADLTPIPAPAAAVVAPTPVETPSKAPEKMISTPEFASGAMPMQSVPPPVVEEEDDPNAKVPEGTRCRRLGCGLVFESNEVHRSDNDTSRCIYHPKQPIFHEGSKGYLCCKPRVLEFEEFLRIKGCAEGRHVFVPKPRADGQEELTDCRVDHYQTPTEVHVSVFAKKADQSRSTVKITPSELHLDLYLPGSRRFKRSIVLFDLVDAEASIFKYYGTKVEITLKKQHGRSWTILEKPDRDLGPVAFTFGVQGRTGTIGGKDLILDADNQLRS